MKNKNFVVTINRVFGSGGGEIARKLGKKLGVNVYGKEVLKQLVEKFNLTETELEKIKAQKTSWWSDIVLFYNQFDSLGNPYTDFNAEVTSLQLYNAEAQLLKEISDRESCVIIGRSGFHIFRNDDNAVKILILADREECIKRVMKNTDMDEKSVEKLMDRIDISRENYTKSFAECSRYEARNYDLVINVSGMKVDEAVDFIYNYVKVKQGL